MSIKLEIYYADLKQKILNPEMVTLNGNTIGECLNDLVRQFPGAKDYLFNGHGQLLSHIFVYVNQESLSQTGLATPVKDGDKLILAALVLGG